MAISLVEGACFEVGDVVCVERPAAKSERKGGGALDVELRLFPEREFTRGAIAYEHLSGGRIRSEASGRSRDATVDVADANEPLEPPGPDVAVVRVAPVPCPPDLLVRL